MKRRIILLISCILIMVFCLGGCIEDSTATQTISSKATQEVDGSYFLFKTTDSQEYLNFLEKFDETKYEIVDISTSDRIYLDGSDEFYMVTYKLKSE